MENFSFWKWYTETAEKSGALVSYTIAGIMLGTTRQYIQNLVYREKIPMYEYQGMKFIGLNDLQKIIIKRQEYLENRKDLKRLVYNSAQKEIKEDWDEVEKEAKEMITIIEKYKQEGKTEDEAFNLYFKNKRASN